MGNCGQSATKQIAEEEEKQFEFHPPEAQEKDYDDSAEEEEEQGYYDRAKAVDPSETIPSSSTAATNTPVFLQTPDAEEIESEDPELMSAAGSSPTKKPMDPRLMSVLEFFRQLYVRKNVLFGRIISIHWEDFVELLNYMERSKEMEKEEAKVKSMKRSHSFAAVRGVKLDDSELKLQRFKVKTLGTDDDDPKGKGPRGGAGGGGTKTAGGSK
ncbi:hypothetical protein Ancab_023669 [Ancistrocladus abbreviatus]